MDVKLFNSKLAEFSADREGLEDIAAFPVKAFKSFLSTGFK